MKQLINLGKRNDQQGKVWYISGKVLFFFTDLVCLSQNIADNTHIFTLLKVSWNLRNSEEKKWLNESHAIPWVLNR